MTKKDSKLLAKFSDGISGLVFWSFRYFLHRRSISASCFAGEIAEAWPLLPERDQTLIAIELTQAYSAKKSSYDALDDHGRQMWRCVMNAAGLPVKG